MQGWTGKTEKRQNMGYLSAEDKKAEENARKQAIAVLTSFMDDAAVLLYDLEHGDGEPGDDAWTFMLKANVLAQHLTGLEVIREVRRRHEAYLMETGYTPSPGDIVMFPRAPQPWNRKHPYEIVSVGLTAAIYRPWPPGGREDQADLDYLRKMGMRPASEQEKAVKPAVCEGGC